MILFAAGEQVGTSNEEERTNQGNRRVMRRRPAPRSVLPLATLKSIFFLFLTLRFLFPCTISGKSQIALRFPAMVHLAEMEGFEPSRHFRTLLP